MSEVWDSYPFDDVAGLIFLLALADWSNDEGVSWPSVSTLAVKCRQSERNVQYQRARFVELGVLTVQSGHGRKSNTYVLGVQRLHQCKAVAPQGCKALAPNTSLDTPELISGATKSKTELLKEFAALIFKEYPNHANALYGKQKIIVALKRIVTDNEVEGVTNATLARDYLLRRVREFAITQKDVEREYVPHCSTFMTQKRYLDPFVTRRPTPPQRGAQQELVPQTNPADVARETLRRDR
jgi:hypothetical protein